MIEIRLGDRYAKSILALAEEKGMLEEVNKDFELITKVCRQNPDFVIMLKSPIVNGHKKQGIIDRVFKGNLSTLTTHFINIIVRKHREAFLLDIATRFLALHDQKQNLLRGTLISAEKVSENEKAALIRLVKEEWGKELILEEKIDPETIGGFILKVGDYLFDGSVAGKLRQLRQEFENNAYIKTV